jgi:hypothetical protein
MPKEIRSIIEVEAAGGGNVDPCNLSISLLI